MSRVKLFYNVQSHGQMSNTEGILKELDSDLAQIDLSFDGEIPDNHFKVSSLVSVRRSNPIVWCGPSQNYQFLDALKNAVNHDGWDYFINLSSACVPLVSQEELSSFLRLKWTSDRKRNFVYGFPVKKKREYQSYSEKVSKSKESHNYNRIKIVVDDALRKRFLDGSLDPVKNVYQRSGFHCTENLEEKSLVLRGLSQWEVDFRESFYSENPLYAGRTWVILHRSQVEWLLSSSMVMDHYNFYSTHFEPDESFIPSILLNENNKFIQEVECNNYRFALGAPSRLKMSDLEGCKASKALFARKLPQDIYTQFAKALR